MNPKINFLVEAYIDFNFGDDVFLDILFTKYPSVNFYLLFNKPIEQKYQELFSKYDNVELISHSKAVNIPYSLDCYIIIGGDMFPNFEPLQNFRLNTISQLIKKNNMEFYIVGVSLYDEHEYDCDVERKIIELFELATAATVRDTKSFNFLASKSSKINVELAADIVFLADKYKKNKVFKQNQCLGISVRKKDNLAETDYVNYCNWVAALIKEYLNQNDSHMVKLFAFSTGVFNDADVIKDIMKIIELINITDIKDRIGIVNYDGNIDNFSQKISQCDHMITTRFHSLIFSLIYGINFTPIIYAAKINNLLDEIDYKGIRLNYESLLSHSPSNIIEELNKNSILYDNKLLLNYSKRAMINFKFLYNLIEQCNSGKTAVSKNKKTIDNTRDKLISIVLPTYNGEKHIKYSIESCLDQSYKNLELIVVDDGSRDNTPDIVREYMRKDVRINLISHQTNKKLPTALNTGFKVAKGDYLTWTSDDNLYHYLALEKMAEELDNNPSVDIVHADFMYIDYLGRPMNAVEIGHAEMLLWSHNCKGPCFLYRKNVQNFLNGYNEQLFLVEDYDFWLRAYIAGFKFKNFPGILYYFRHHPKSLSSLHLQNVQIMAENLKKEHAVKLIFNRSVFIWGVGNIGLNLQRKMSKSEFAVAGFIDNDSANWQQKINDVEIYPPQFLQEIKENRPFIIIGSMFKEEVEKTEQELEVMGFEKGFDFIDGMNKVLLSLF